MIEKIGFFDKLFVFRYIKHVGMYSAIRSWNRTQKQKLIMKILIARFESELDFIDFQKRARFQKCYI
jgi:hypothetical protein